MQLDVHVEDPDELRSLRGWLAGEPAVRSHGQLRVVPSVQPGQLGAVEIIALVVGSGLTLAQLVLSIVQWRETRPDRPAVTVTRTGPDGSLTRIESSDPEAVAAVVRALEAQ